MHADDGDRETAPLDPDTGLPQEPNPDAADDDPPEAPGENDTEHPLPGDGLGDELRGDALAKPDFALTSRRAAPTPWAARRVGRQARSGDAVTAPREIAGDLVATTDLSRTFETLAELAEAAGEAVLYVRYSEGPEDDRESGSIDTESGLELPGLSVNPLRPEQWWSRPVTDWLARQVCQYRSLQEKNPDRFAWVLTGREVARGPDCEPLLRECRPVARLADSLLDEALARYHERFDAGRGPEDS
jgi:hypothetical protein